MYIILYIAGIREPLFFLALNSQSFLVSLSLLRFAIARTGAAVLTTHFTRLDACQCKIYTHTHTHPAPGLGPPQLKNPICAPNLSTVYASGMWNDRLAKRKHLKSIVLILGIILFKFMCLIPVSCDVIVYTNMNAAVCDLNRVTRCPDRPNFMRSVSMQTKNN